LSVVHRSSGHFISIQAAETGEKTLHLNSSNFEYTHTNAINHLQGNLDAVVVPFPISKRFVTGLHLIKLCVLTKNEEKYFCSSLILEIRTNAAANL